VIVEFSELLHEDFDNLTELFEKLLEFGWEFLVGMGGIGLFPKVVDVLV
jgi:hypothetical protein